MSKATVFFRDTVAELRKVVWPSRESVASSAKVVLISTLLFAAFFGIVDFLLLRGLYSIF